VCLGVVSGIWGLLAPIQTLTMWAIVLSEVGRSIVRSHDDEAAVGRVGLAKVHSEVACLGVEVRPIRLTVHRTVLVGGGVNVTVRCVVIAALD